MEEYVNLNIPVGSRQQKKIRGRPLFVTRRAWLDFWGASCFPRLPSSRVWHLPIYRHFKHLQITADAVDIVYRPFVKLMKQEYMVYGYDSVTEADILAHPEIAGIHQDSHAAVQKIEGTVSCFPCNMVEISVPFKNF